VWWSPEEAVLTLGAQTPLGLRRDDLIVKDVAADVLQAHLASFSAWQTAKADAVAQAARPSIEVLTVTEWADYLERRQVEDTLLSRSSRRSTESRW